MNVWAANLKALIFIREIKQLLEKTNHKKAPVANTQKGQGEKLGRGGMCATAISVQVYVESDKWLGTETSVLPHWHYPKVVTIFFYHTFDWKFFSLFLFVQTGDVEQPGHPRHPLLPWWGGLPMSSRFQMCRSGETGPQQTRAGLQWLQWTRYSPSCDALFLFILDSSLLWFLFSIWANINHHQPILYSNTQQTSSGIQLWGLY